MWAVRITITIMENKQLIDIHTHILFGIDDGARDLEESIEMAQMWSSQNVHTVVASPHFDIKKDNREDFLETRDRNTDLLRKELKIKSINLEILKSAELYFRHNLIHEDLSPFTIEGTNTLLIELPTRSVPPQIASTFEELIMQGYQVILVHIERYPILKNDLELFYNLANMGVIFQVNAETILKEQSSWLKAAIKKNYVHLLGSDAHRKDKRLPNIEEALIKSEKLEYYNNNANKIIRNQELNTVQVNKINKLFNIYI